MKLFNSTISLSGFTLSELLISLSVLGLISAMTLPTVFNSVNQQKKKAIFKETINTISTLNYQSAMDGTIGNSVSFIDNINTTKICADSSTVANCATNSNYVTGAGFIMHNGAYVWGLDHSMGEGSDTFMIDYNGPEGNNTEGDDVIRLGRCIDLNVASDPDPCTNLSGVPQLGNVSPKTRHGTSVTMWQELF